MGEPVCHYVDQAFLKQPFVGSQKDIHQDNDYFAVVPDDAVLTCWCALDDATLENGCMHYVAGSHKLKHVPHEKIPGTPHHVPKNPEQYIGTPVPINSGGVIFHHGWTLHYSPQNRSNKPRRAWAIHLIRGNAVKGVTVMLLTVLSVAMFAGTGHVDWPVGLALGLGNLIGGLVGVRIALVSGHRWLERALTATVILFAILLWVV